MTYFKDPNMVPESDRDEYRRKLCGWIQANGLDYKTIVARPGIVLAGQHIMFTQFVMTKLKTGRQVRTWKPGYTGYVTRQGKTRCIVSWADAPTLTKI